VFLNDKLISIIKSRGLDLDEDQLNFITAPKGPLAVQAGPGCGKTECMIFRGINMVLSYDLRPASLCFVTFTRRATESMKLRLLELSKHVNIDDLLDCYVNTLHGFALDFLESNKKLARELQLPIDLHPIDDEMLGMLVLQLKSYKKLKWLGCNRDSQSTSNKQPLRFKTLKQYLSLREQEIEFDLEKLQQLFELNDLNESHLNLFEDFYQEFCDLITQEKLVTYDRIIKYALVLLKERANEIKNNFEFFAVDEFQDINQIQFKLLRQLSYPNYNITVVGDPEQSIYRFRGAVPEIFNEFEKLTNASRLKLSKNYRACLELTEVLKSFDIGKELQIKPFSSLYKIKPKSGSVNADLVVKSIKKLKEKNYVSNWGDIAVLARSVKGDLRAVVTKIKNSEIPFVIGSDKGLLYCDLVMAFIGVLFEAYNDLGGWEIKDPNEKKYLEGCEKILEKPEFNQLRKEKDRILQNKPDNFYVLEKLLDKAMPLAPFSEALLDPEITLGWLPFVKLIQNYVVVFGSDLRKFFRKFLPNLVDAQPNTMDFSDEALPIDKVFVSTIHQAKGLEFPVVIIVSPVDKKKDEKQSFVNDDIKNIVRVGITRASDILIVAFKDNSTECLRPIEKTAILIDQNTDFTKVRANKVSSGLVIAEASNLLTPRKCHRRYGATVGLKLTVKPTLNTVKGDIFHAVLAELSLKQINGGLQQIQENELLELIYSYKNQHPRGDRVLDEFVKDIKRRVKNALTALDVISSNGYKLSLAEQQFCISEALLLNNTSGLNQDNMDSLRRVCYVRPDLIIEKNSAIGAVEFKLGDPENKDVAYSYKIQLQAQAYIVSKLQGKNLAKCFLIYGNDPNPIEVSDLLEQHVIDVIEQTWEIVGSAYFKRPKYLSVAPTSSECNDCPIKLACESRYKAS